MFPEEKSITASLWEIAIVKIKGITAKQARVSPTCRATWGNNKAAQIAVGHLLSEYADLVHLPANKDATFHFVLSVEREE